MSGEPPRDDDEPNATSAPPAADAAHDSDAPAPARESGPAPAFSTGLDGVLRRGATPSFFPEGDEDLDAYLDQLLPSLVPSAPEAAERSDSGLRISHGDTDSPPRLQHDDVSQVVALHDDPVPEPSEEPLQAFSSSDALALLAMDERGFDVDAPAPVDEAALATLTSLPRRAPGVAQNPLLLEGPAGDTSRAGLLEALARQADSPAVQAQLLSHAAELSERRSDGERAQKLRARAADTDPSDVYALREARRDATIALDFARQAELLKCEAAISTTGADRSLLFTALAELRLRCLGDPEGALEAAREAQAVDSHALPAALLAAEVHFARGEDAQGAEALQRGAQGLLDGALRCGLLCHAGRALLLAGDAPSAQLCFGQALDADPTSDEARLGLYRAARAANDVTAAVGCLGELAEQLPGAPTRDELLRRRGTLELWALGDARAALASLAQLKSPLATRATLVAAERAGERDARRAALEAWVAQGLQPALAWLERARAHLDDGEHAQAAQALTRAAELDPDLALVRVAQQSLARLHGDAPSLASAVDDEGEHNRLGAAAKLGASPSHAATERELLLGARADLDDKPTTDALLLDAAAEAGDLDAVRRGLWTRTERGSAAGRVGPLTALLDLPSVGPDSEAVREVLRTGLRAAGGSTAMLRQALDAERDTEARAALWRAEATRVAPARAAFALTMAARELALGEHDPCGTFEASLAIDPGYGPAAWALEHAARRAGYTDTLVRVHAALASAEADPLERRARAIRVGLLYAGTNPTLARQHLYEAARIDPADPIVANLLMRLSEGTVSERLGTSLLKSASPASPGFRRATSLLAAEIYVGAGEPERAVTLYCEWLAPGAQRDPLAAHGFERALRSARRLGELRDWLAECASAAADGPHRARLLEALANLELQRGDPGAAVLVLEQRLSAAPADVATLRAAIGLAMRADRKLSLARHTEALASLLEDPADRGAELWQALRMRELSRSRDQAELDALVERLAREGQREMWSGLAQEELARRTGRPHAIADALGRIESLLADPDERASLALRAAEALEPLAVQSALDAIEDEAEAAPDHPLIHEELGRLAEQAGQLERAVAAFAHAASRARSDERRLRLWYHVAVLAQDRLDARALAVDALESVIGIDVLYREAFARLRELHRSAQDRRALIRLYERRLERGAASPVAAELNTEICQLALELGDRERAKQALAAAMEVDPERVQTLQALATLHLSDGDHRAAADVLVRLARSTHDTDLLLWSFRQLGALYDGPLADLKRAEIAYTRVLGLEPDDDPAVERLATIFARTGQHSRALRAWQTLVERHAQQPELWERYSLELARQLEHTGQASDAEKLLEQLRSAHPTSLAVVDALAAHYRAQGAEASVLVHLDRSIHAFRSAVRERPDSVDAWTGLIATLEGRRHPRAAAACRSAARALGLSEIAAADQPPAGLGPRIRSAASVQRALPKAWSVPLRSLLRAAAPAFDRLLPYPTEGLGERSARELPEGVASTATRVAEWFGLPAPSLYTCARPVCVAIRERPFALLVGENLLESLDTAALGYLFARAAAQASAHSSFLSRAQPEQIELALQGLLLVLDPGHKLATADPDAAQRMAAELTPLLADQRAELFTGAAELASAGRIDVLSLTNLAMEVGAREALLATADLGAALRALAHAAPDAQPPATAVELVQRDAEADALLYFAVSDPYLAALEEAST